MSHALFSPSAAERWMRCGYSVKMSKFYPSTTNAAAEEGTRQHAIAADLLLSGENANSVLQTYLQLVRNQPGELFVERKVVIVPDLCEGTADAIRVDAPEALYVSDLKFGKKLVHATDNLQLKLYALGALREFPLPRYAKVRLTIIQPNSTGIPVRPWDTTVEHILKFKPKVEAAIEEGLKENPKAVAGSHCFWCPAKIHCHAYLLHIGKK
jgi:hypothetical protein